MGWRIILVKTNSPAAMESGEQANLFAGAKRIDYSAPVFYTHKWEEVSELASIVLILHG